MEAQQRPEDARAAEAWSSRAHEDGDPPCSSGAGVLVVGEAR